MSPAKRAVWREGTAEDPELVPMRVKIWISSQGSVKEFSQNGLQALA